MTLSVLMFARAREIVGKSSVKVDVPADCSVKTLVAAVLKLYPAIEALMKNMVLSLNLEYVAADSDQILKSTDEVHARRSAIPQLIRSVHGRLRLFRRSVVVDVLHVALRSLLRPWHGTASVSLANALCGWLVGKGRGRSCAMSRVHNMHQLLPLPAGAGTPSTGFRLLGHSSKQHRTMNRKLAEQHHQHATSER